MGDVLGSSSIHDVSRRKVVGVWEVATVQETSSVCWQSGLGREILGLTSVGLCRQENPGLGACESFTVEVSEVGLHTSWPSLRGLLHPHC